MRIITPLFGLCILLSGYPASDAEAAGPRAAVTAFSEAISAGELDTVLALLADGGQQFTLRSSHQGVKTGGLTSEIVKYWSMIAPVLFAATESYSRTVDIIDYHAEGDVATVWTRTQTTSLRKGAMEDVRNDFTEIYLLIKTADGWKIAAIADNRETTKIADLPDEPMSETAPD